MSKHILKVLEANFVTHNVKRIVIERPAGLHFISGQAADVSINKPGFEEQLRPFTFTSTNDLDYLEFMIKIYPDHNGVTKELGSIKVGDELILHDVFGSITYQGPGLFIAAGAGITPFVSIFRDLKKQGKLTGNTLLFANRTENDVILKDELQSLLGDNLINVIETSAFPSVPPQFITHDLLKSYVNSNNEYYYICGPDAFTNIMVEHLVELGVDKSKIIIEQ